MNNADCDFQSSCRWTSAKSAAAPVKSIGKGSSSGFFRALFKNDLGRSLESHVKDFRVISFRLDAVWVIEFEMNRFAEVSREGSEKTAEG